MKSSEIRQQFINYFKQHNHQEVSSSPLVPANDPTLLFTNAGMVQFKETFLGIEPRSYQRAVSSQRCVRAGGKHNDLDNVGYTARHHTFFEMLGNFSFGDYFKEQAIRFAWQFLTEVLAIPEEKLWVTVYTDDDEAADIWLKQLNVSAERFSRCGEKDNFWSMGDTGPCGPCTEIFYDHGPEIAGGPPGSPDEDGDRYIEIWNLVFMQYNRDKAGTLTPLPKPSVDTGMGLERIAAVIQGVHSNYEIDLFVHLINSVKALCPAGFDENSPSLKVIADHIRACAFLICDGIIPSNEGRGYVLRRIIRRAVRHGNKLGINESFFYQLVSALIDVMGDAYPELNENKSHIEKTLLLEEQQFARTIDNGLRLLNQAIAELSDTVISGDIAFKLYDTYGFPLDLTADIAREKGLTVDEKGFDHLMKQRVALSQSDNQFKTDYSSVVDINQQSEFSGYQFNEKDATVTAILTADGLVDELTQGQQGALIVDKTPFYAESGGQVGDSGVIDFDGGSFLVEDTQKQGDAILHSGKVLEGKVICNQSVNAKIDVSRRDAIRLNHSATHLVHAALKQVLGDHVQQKGSLVDSERARFDFSHYQGMSTDEITQVEALVNQKIRQNLDIITEEMTADQAKKANAVALFGEKYGDTVRVLTIGDFSKELCGGTHARRTGDIGIFKIISESGIASGVRRIEMMTGEYALCWCNNQIERLNEASLLLKTDKDQVVNKLSQFLHDSKQKDKLVDKLKQQLANQSSDDLLNQIQQLAGVNLLAVKLEGGDSKSLRDTLDKLKSKLEKAVIVLTMINGDKMNVIAGVTKDVVGSTVGAKELVQHVCGKGGGREDMAQGGGKVPADIDDRLKSLAQIIESHPVN